MPVSRRNSLRINFGNRDPVDALLFETVKTVADGSACGRAAAAKRLMTLGTLLFNGYDPRLITDRLPKQKVLWVEVIWPLLRDYAAGTLEGRSSSSDETNANESSSGRSTLGKGVPLPPPATSAAEADTVMEFGHPTTSSADRGRELQRTELPTATRSLLFDLGKLKFP
jgi:hypothetical protein